MSVSEPSASSDSFETTLDAAGQILNERGREMSLAPPPYQPRSDDDRSQMDHSDLAEEFPDPEENPTVARKEAERKFKEAADKLNELVKKNKREPGEVVTDAPTDFSDEAIKKHTQSIKAVMEDILRQKVESAATRSKTSEFIDKWIQATLPVVKATLQMLSVRCGVNSMLTYSLFLRLTLLSPMGLCV